MKIKDEVILMVCRFEDLRCKEVINIRTGCKLGYPDDAEFESCTAKIIRLIVYGRSRFFGIFGREDDIVIPWCDIEIIGEDTILVTCDFPARGKRAGFVKNFIK
ncbi:MAG: YlmC/YmxH family sporulation protein [Oscillospiraceae bacterium]|nr:YlmC/YmxH family sporulation protein [Oscillospiraceae bacterium]